MLGPCARLVRTWRLPLSVLALASSGACVATGSKVIGTAGGSGGGQPSSAGYGGYGAYGGSMAAGSPTSMYSVNGSQAMASTGYPVASSTADNSAAATVVAASSSTGAPCMGTRVTYGALWIASNPNGYDDVNGPVTWDGTCTTQSPNSYAILSNTWKPFFTGSDGCVMGFDSLCAPNPPPPCTTRITYGAAWLPAANHPQNYDDVNGKVTWNNNRQCVNSGSVSYGDLSNGWQPHFSGSNACAMSFRYENCGGV